MRIALKSRIRNVVLEGADCVGKSTVAGILTRHTSTFSRIIHVSNPKNESDGREVFTNLASKMNAGSGIVFDRAQVGERVYAPIMRGYYPDYMDELDERIDGSTLFVLLVASERALIERWDGKFVKDEEQLLGVQDRFFTEFVRAPLESKMIVDTTILSPDLVARNIAEAAGARRLA